jgi:hypothetical protein
MQARSAYHNVSARPNIAHPSLYLFDVCLFGPRCLLASWGLRHWRGWSAWVGAYPKIASARSAHKVLRKLCGNLIDTYPSPTQLNRSYSHTYDVAYRAKAQPSTSFHRGKLDCKFQYV